MSDLFQEFLTEAKSFSPLELIAVLAALAYVYFAAKEKAVCFFFGLLSSLIYIYICYKYKLYFDSFINLYYVCMSAVGWYYWKRKTNNKKLNITYLGKKKFFLLAFSGIAITVSLAFLADRYTDTSLPYLDAFTTVFAMIATWMIVKKQIENWLIWIVVDGLSIGMYFYKGLFLTSFLFLTYTVIAVLGYLNWRKKIKNLAKTFIIASCCVVLI